MNDEAAFLKALRDNPADDTARLVYADLLDERSDPRAEFIRLRQQYAQVTARINELASQCDPAWLAAVGGPRTKERDITLRSGRRVRLEELRQWNIYSGLLEGPPMQEWNQRTIERIIEEQRASHIGHLLIQPEEKLIETDNPLYNRVGTPAAIPSVACVGSFNSSPARDMTRHASGLTIIWFQDEFALPIDPAMREQLRAIDWEKHATDFDY
jgi:uncharacterized protein (TIGR02996 family)